MERGKTWSQAVEAGSENARRGERRRRRLYVRPRTQHEAHFLEELSGCGDAEVKGYPVLMRVANQHDWPEAAAALIERGAT